MIYLYQLHFDVGDPFYIGISKNLQKRKLSHIYRAKNGRMPKDKFIRRHIGSQSLCIEPLGVFESIKEAERIERLLIDRSPWCLNVRHNDTVETAQQEFYIWCPECKYGWINAVDNNKCAFRNVNHGQSLLLAKWTRDRNTNEVYNYTELTGRSQLARRWY